MFIVFCTGIYMGMNNVRVGELRCYILNQKDPGSNPTIKMKKESLPRSRQQHGKFDTIKKSSILPPRFIPPSVSDPVVEIREKSLSEFNTKYPGGINCFSIVIINFGKSTTTFIQTFIKTYHSESKQTFWGKILYVSFI